MLNVLNGGVGLDVGIELEGDAILLQQIGDLLGNAELDQIGVGGDEGLLEALALDDAGNLLDGAVAVVGDAVQNETIDRHNGTPFKNKSRDNRVRAAGKAGKHSRGETGFLCFCRKFYQFQRSLSTV